MDSSKLSVFEDGAYLLLPQANIIDVSLIDYVIQTPLPDSHKGWALVRAVKAVLSGGQNALVNTSNDVQTAMIQIAKSLCGHIPAAKQISVLEVLAAGRPARDSLTGRIYKKFIEEFSRTGEFYEHVLPVIDLPTQDGQWHKAKDIARSTIGIARRHKLLDEYFNILCKNTISVTPGEIEKFRAGDTTINVIENYFDTWKNQLPNSAIGAFILLLGGRNDLILSLAEKWVGQDNNIHGMRDMISQGNEQHPIYSILVSVESNAVKGQTVKTYNLLGNPEEMDVGSDNEMIFASDPFKVKSSKGAFWNIQLREINVKNRKPQELKKLLNNTVEWWAVNVLNIDIHAIRSWWSKWGTGSQAQIGPVIASIRANLPLTLHQLDINECHTLKDALQKAESAQRKREQAPTQHLGEAISLEREYLKNLANLIQDQPTYQRFIWSRVQEIMKRYGYREDSVLIELAQNADDALAQSAEIKDLPNDARKLIIRVTGNNNESTIDVIHYGRPINETGGAAFPSGKDRQWDQDLYFMMLLNLSAKPGEISGESTRASTTGRFGLGFKSIHLVSETPSVVSGFLSFKIVAGLLPVENAIPDDPELQQANRCPVTRIRLPVVKTDDADGLIRNIFSRFNYTRTLLPAFSRQIQEIIIENGPFAGRSKFEAEFIDSALGWSISKEMVSVPDNGQWRLLRFRLSDIDNGHGTEALVVGLRNGYPESFPTQIPFLWNVTPTSEGWGCGYAVNGPFKIDPGRTHVSLDDKWTFRVFDLLGQALGAGLIALYDALNQNGSKAATQLLDNDGNAMDFLIHLWNVLSTSLDNRDELRSKLLNRLHGTGKGISAWIHARPVLPSGLPSPFLKQLPKLDAEIQVEVAADAFNKDVCSTFNNVDYLRDIVHRHYVISNEMKKCLDILHVDISVRPISPSKILQELVEQWNNELTPERLHSLRSLSEDSVWKAIQNDAGADPWCTNLRARSVTGEFIPLKYLLVNPNLTQVQEHSKIERDELLRAAFAPDSNVLSPDYIDSQNDVDLFLRLRVRHKIDAETMASWYRQINVERQIAALRYLLDGSLQNEVLKQIIQTPDRPAWLNDYDKVSGLIEQFHEDHWRTRSLLTALFPDRFQQTSSGPKPPPPNGNFFHLLGVWWGDNQTRQEVITAYESAAWPSFLRDVGIADGLKKNSEDHWLGLLVLGACRSIGMKKKEQHRKFVETAHSNGWWAVFKNPGDSDKWMEMLREWQDNSVAHLPYLPWFSLFPIIYQLSRYLEKYRRLLLTAGCRSAELFDVKFLLAPREDSALTGAGRHFDAPPAPLNMGIHWILRELIRLHVIDGEHIYPDCCVPSDQLIRFLSTIGMNPLDDNDPNPEKARRIYEFFKSNLGAQNANLHRTFDIPLLHVGSNLEIKRKLGLED